MASLVSTKKERSNENSDIIAFQCTGSTKSINVLWDFLTAEKDVDERNQINEWFICLQSAQWRTTELGSDNPSRSFISLSDAMIALEESCLGQTELHKPWGLGLDTSSAILSHSLPARGFNRNIFKQQHGRGLGWKRSSFPKETKRVDYVIPEKKKSVNQESHPIRKARYGDGSGPFL